MNKNMDMNQSSEPIDYESALERTGGDREFLQELLDMYLEDFSEKFSLLKQAVAATDTGLIYELAHNLKGSAANLSLIPLQNILYQIELAGRENKTDEADRCLFSLEKEFERLQALVKDKDSSQL